MSAEAKFSLRGETESVGLCLWIRETTPSGNVQLSNERGPIEAVGYLENIFRLSLPPRDLQQPKKPRAVLLVEPCCTLSHYD